jgi:hypothetical protein
MINPKEQQKHVSGKTQKNTETPGENDLCSSKVDERE